jgi:hypothetical protein
VLDNLDPDEPQWEIHGRHLWGSCAQPSVLGWARCEVFRNARGSDAVMQGHADVIENRLHILRQVFPSEAIFVGQTKIQVGFATILISSSLRVAKRSGATSPARFAFEMSHSSWGGAGRPGASRPAI